MQGLEIERKWLLDLSNIPRDFDSAEKIQRMEQAYISFSPTIRIRMINEEQFVLTVKSHGGKGSGKYSRTEYELEISAEEYRNLMQKHEGNIIRKTRYVFQAENDLKEEIDIFSGALAGLAYLEIEFPDEASAAAYPGPAFAVRDVSDDKRYTNAYLSANGITLQ